MKKGLFLCCLVVLLSNAVRADVSLLVLEAIGVAGEYTGSGHTSIYLSNVCAESPIKLRMCRAGERGVVISSYPSFVKNANYEWMAVPLIPYLYGVADESDIPLYANGKIRNFLREEYRRNNLSSVVRGHENGMMPKGDWQIMLTAAFNRDIYSLNIQTSLAEDEEFLREFNRKPNEGNFSSFTSNCADFSRKLINRYFPGAAKRDWINDIGVTTPKAVARSFTNYIKSRPDRFFYMGRYTQVSGPIWRSFDNRNFTEMAFKSKKYLIPSLVFDPILVPIFAGSYLLTGRFNLHKTYREYPSSQIAQLKLDRQNLKLQPRSDSAAVATEKAIEKKIEAEKFELLGDGISWKAYTAKFDQILTNAIAQGLFQDTNEVKSFFKDLELQSEPAMDADGGLILKVRYYAQDRELGISYKNILNANSDKELALKLMLAKINAELNAPEKDRSSMPEFRANWKLMRHLLNDGSLFLAGVNKNRGRFLKEQPPPNVMRKLEKLVISITH